MKVVRNPESVHKPLAPYNHQIETTGNMRWLTLSVNLVWTLRRMYQKIPQNS